MATTEAKCACSDCNCSVSADQAVHKDGKTYCCEACASGHADHAACAHEGCGCHG